MENNPEYTNKPKNIRIKSILLPILIFSMILVFALPCAAQNNQKDITNAGISCNTNQNGKSITQTALTLKEVVAQAIKNNFLVKEAAEREKAAFQKEKSTKADFFPKLTSSYSYNHLNDEPYGIFANLPFPIAAKNDIAWNITITQPVFTGYALTTRHKIASLGIDISKIIKDKAILDVAEQAKIAFFKKLLAKKGLKVAEEEVRQLKAHVRDAEAMYNQGIVPYNDLLKSKVALAEARQNKAKALSRVAISLAALNTILSKNIMDKTIITDSHNSFNNTYTLSALFKTAVQNRPELKHLKLAIRQAGLAIKLAKSAYYPSIALIGRYEREGDNITASNNDYANDHNIIVGIQAKWTIFDWGKTRANAEEAIHKKNSLEQKIKSIKDSILLEVKSSFEHLKLAQQNINTAKKALAQAKENFRITNLQYQQGTNTSTEVLDARTFLTRAEDNLFNAIYGYKIAQAQLMRAIGNQ